MAGDVTFADAFVLLLLGALVVVTMMGAKFYWMYRGMRHSYYGIKSKLSQVMADGATGDREDGTNGHADATSIATPTAAAGDAGDDDGGGGDAAVVDARANGGDDRPAEAAVGKSGTFADLCVESSVGHGTEDGGGGGGGDRRSSGSRKE